MRSCDDHIVPLSLFSADRHVHLLILVPTSHGVVPLKFPCTSFWWWSLPPEMPAELPAGVPFGSGEAAGAVPRVPANYTVRREGRARKRFRGCIINQVRIS